MTSNQPERGPRKVVVCGTSFGRIYLKGMAEDPTVRLVGVLSRGSAASRACADTYQVPSFTDVDQLPDDVEVACVAVRAGVAGGEGGELAQRLLTRRVHVLQEHLLHPDELAACLRTAHENGVCYRLNAFYPHLRPVRLFLEAARTLRARQPALFVDAMAGGQVVYPLLDVIGRALGGLRPWALAEPVPLPPELGALAAHPTPYAQLHGVIAGVPLSLRVQNQVHPADPDNHALLLHRLAIAFEGGVLTLADTHGPVLWSPRMHSDRDEHGRLIMDGPGTERLDVPGTEPLGAAHGPTFHEVFTDLWPDSTRAAFAELRADIADPHRRIGAGQWALTVTAIWHRLTTVLGAPELIHPAAPEPVPLPELMTEPVTEPAAAGGPG